MAQTTYTLEEAAEKLGITPEDMKRRIREEWKSLRSFRDGPTLRFRANEIDELARTMGLGSDSEGPAPVKKPQPADDFDLDLEEKPVKSPPPPVAKAKKKDEPILFGDDDDEILAGLTSQEPKKEAPKPPVGKKKKPESDSDVRIETYPPTKGQKLGGLTEDEIDFDLPAPAGASGVLASGNSSSRIKAGGSGKLVPKSQGGSGKIGTGASSSKLPKASQGGGSGRMDKAKLPLQPDLNSEFELSLEDSDFELQLNDDSEEVDLGELPVSRERDSAGKSGINIGNPADSGISLESKRTKPKSDKIAPIPVSDGSDEEIDFELSLDVGASSSKMGNSKKMVADDSEFELSLEEDDLSTLDDPTSSFGEEENKDIFETDFEIPALDDDSASEAIALDEADTDLESSDFDLALDDSDVSSDDESASEVVVLDEDDEPTNSRKKKRPASLSEALGKANRRVSSSDDDEEGVDYDDLDESESASGALRGVRADDEDDDDDEPVTAGAGAGVYAKAAPWGPFTVFLLFMTIPLIFLGGLMGYELLNGMWGYQQPFKPASPIVQFLAEKFDVLPKQ